MPLTPRPRCGTTALAALVALVAACAADGTAPGGGTYPVVHAVLNPLAGAQYVLVELALTGAVARDTLAQYDPREPILAGGGIPVSGAQVHLTGPRRDLWIPERAFFIPSTPLSGFVADGLGHGVYFWLNYEPPPPLPFEPEPPDVFMRVFAGDTWELEIGWPDGSRVVRGRTTVPRYAPLPGEVPRAFNRDRDTLVIELPGPAAAIDAARYMVRVATPYGPLTFFTDSARVRLTGALVNVDAPGAPPAFAAGFSQLVEIAAVDLNYYDYYRSRGSARGGTAQVSHLTGAAGLFGAYVPMGVRLVEVTGDQDQPGEGSFGRTTAPRDTLELYRAGSRLSGRLRGGGAAGRRGNLLGTLDGSAVRLAVVSFQRIGDTLATFGGRLDGTAIVGQFSDEAQPSTFQRAP